MLPFKELEDYLFLFFDNTEANANKVERNKHTKYVLQRVNITNYNELIDWRNLYDQSIYGIIKQYDEIRKVATRQGNDYTMGWLLDYQYIKDHFI